MATVAQTVLIYGRLRFAMRFARRGGINKNVETLKFAMWDVSTCTATAVDVFTVM